MSETVRHRFRARRTGPMRAEAQAAANSTPSRVAMRLALAYQVERDVEAGVVESFADAAARLGITRARMTQVLNLLLLPAAEQSALLSPSLDKSLPSQPEATGLRSPALRLP